MKIAIPTRGKEVDEHFGHCEYYTLYTIEDGTRIAKIETLDSPQGCGCKSNVASILREKGVTHLLAGNMGTGALNVLQAQGINVVRGCSGDTLSVINSYLKGTVSDSGQGCSAHDNHHICNHTH